MDYFYVDEDGELVLAPSVLTFDDGSHMSNPPPAIRKKHGQYPKREGQVPPPAPDGKRTVHDEWILENDEWVETWKFEDIPVEYRTFSKLKIVAALIKSGVWEQVKQYITDAGLYDLFLAAQNFREDNEFFERGKTALIKQLGWTNEQVEGILQNSIADED